MTLLDQMRAVKLPEGLTLRPDEFNSSVLVAEVEHDGCYEDLLLMFEASEGRGLVKVMGWGRTSPVHDGRPDRTRKAIVWPEDLQGAVDYVLGLLDGGVTP